MKEEASSKPPDDWYRHLWRLDMKRSPWTQGTERQVAFIAERAGIKRGDKVLDLACGFGRHSLALAAIGCEVVGVDLCHDFIMDAKESAKAASLDVTFICADLRDVDFVNEFDVVLSLADGAIGYFESERENAKVFDVVSSALNRGGSYLLDVINARYLEAATPVRTWQRGVGTLSFVEMRWDPTDRRVLHAGVVMNDDERISEGWRRFGSKSSYRLYTYEELSALLTERGLRLLGAWGDFDDTIGPSSHRPALIIHSRKV